MKKTDFSFDLPETLIAQRPPEHRGESRLMALNRKNRTRLHAMAEDLPRLLPEGALLVFNNSRVRKARLPAESLSTGARAEFLLLRREGETRWTCMARRSKRRRAGSRWRFPGGVEGEITGEDGEFRSVEFSVPIDDAWLDANGHIPLPPYIKRPDETGDSESYQTVYAERENPDRSVAAPTAGLHFTESLLADLERSGFETAFVTLHVGAGTFLPVRVENIEDHVMHEESWTIPDEAAEKTERAKTEGRAVCAVGTTSLRTLESAWENGHLRRGQGSTSIFIYPGYRFRVTDALFTNFHTPESTLLMLVSAFAGRDFILESYAEAVRQNYRFFSYGDAMLIT